MRPPIPSPFGGIEDVAAVGKSGRLAMGASISSRLFIYCLPRKEIKELVTCVVSISVVIIVATILTAILHPVFRPSIISLLELWLLFFLGFPVLYIGFASLFSAFGGRRAKTVILTPYGVSRWNGNRETEVSWSAFLCICHWSGDVILSTFDTAVFIPREAFASPDEARQFVQIARELHKTRGAVWRNEWSGKTFGFLPENARQNLPK